MMGFGMGAGGMIVMTVFWVGLLALLIWGVSRTATGNGESRGENPRQDTPEEALDRRYANGELDDDTYRSMRATLISARSGRR